MSNDPEVLDPGPTVYGDVEFVTIVHPDIEGSEAKVPAHLVNHHRQRGWELADSPAEDDLDADEEPEDLPEDLDASDDADPQE